MGYPVITALGHYFPPHVIDNSFFQTLGIDSSDIWIEEHTGIKSRRSVLSPTEITMIKEGRITVSDICQGKFDGDIASFAQASVSCLQRRKKLKGKRGEYLVICGTSVPDWDIPANACVIAAKLGIDSMAVDINSACSSFVVNLHFACQALNAKGTINKVLICNPERYSLRMNYHDRSSCVLFGDGSSSALVENSDNEGLAVIATSIHSDPANYNKVVIPSGQHFHQQGRAVQKFAISRTVEITKTILKDNALTIANIDYFVGHQANRRMLQVVVDKLGLSAEQHLSNVVEYGNQGAAGAPSVLSQNWHRFQAGDTIVVAVVGSGLTWGATILRKI